MSAVETHTALAFLVGAPTLTIAVWVLRDRFDRWLDRHLQGDIGEAND